MYLYQSKVGLFSIKPYNSQWGLFINDDLLGCYNSPVAAADDVYLHVTGFYPWDSLDGKLLNIPTDLYQWESL